MRQFRFRLGEGNRPVRPGDDLLVMLLGMDNYPPESEACYSGLVLREVTDGVFERIGRTGICLSSQGQENYRVDDWENSCAIYDRVVREYVEALPIRQVKII